MNKEHKIFVFNILIFFGIFITIALGGKYIIVSGILAILSAVIMYSYFQECEVRKKLEKEEYELKKDEEKKLLLEVLNKINTSIDKNIEKNIKTLEKMKNEECEKINEVIKMLNEIKENNIENKNQVIYENINNTDRIVKNLINESKKMSIIIKDKAVNQEKIVKNATDVIYSLIKEDDKKLLENVNEAKEQIISNNKALNIENKENYNNKILKVMEVIDKNTDINIKIIEQLKISENNLMKNNLELNKNITLDLAGNAKSNEESFVKLVEKIDEFNKSVLTTQKEEHNKLNDIIAQSTEKIKSEIEKYSEEKIKREKEKEFRTLKVCEGFKEALNKKANEVRNSLGEVNAQIQVSNDKAIKQLTEINNNLEINKENINEANTKVLDKIENFKQLNKEVIKEEADKLNGAVLKLTEHIKEKIDEYKEDSIGREKVREFKRLKRYEEFKIASNKEITEFKSSLKEINKQVQINSDKAINQLMEVNNNLEINKENINEANIKILDKIEDFKEVNIEVTKEETDKLNEALLKLTEDIKGKVNEYKVEKSEREKVRELKTLEKYEEFKNISNKGINELRSSLEEIKGQAQMSGSLIEKQLVIVNSNLEKNKDTIINLAEKNKSEVLEVKKILGDSIIQKNEVLKKKIENIIKMNFTELNENINNSLNNLHKEVNILENDLGNNIEQIKKKNTEIREISSLNLKNIEKLIVELTVLKEKINLKDLELEVKNINKYIEYAFKQQKNIVKNNDKYPINKVDEVAATTVEEEYSKQEDLGVGHYKNGKLISFEYDDGKTVEFKYKNGIIDSTLTKVRGKIESKTTFKDGKIYRDVHYKNNKVEIDYLYYESGEIEKETIYKNGTIEVRRYDEETGERIK